MEVQFLVHKTLLAGPLWVMVLYTDNRYLPLSILIATSPLITLNFCAVLLSQDFSLCYLLADCASCLSLLVPWFRCFPSLSVYCSLLTLAFALYWSLAPSAGYLSLLVHHPVRFLSLSFGLSLFEMAIPLF